MLKEPIDEIIMSKSHSDYDFSLQTIRLPREDKSHFLLV
jgi:hypothetical protein